MGIRGRHGLHNSTAAGAPRLSAGVRVDGREVLLGKAAARGGGGPAAAGPPGPGSSRPVRKEHLFGGGSNRGMWKEGGGIGEGGEGCEGCEWYQVSPRT